MSNYTLNMDPEHQRQLRIGLMNALAAELGLPVYEAPAERPVDAVRALANAQPAFDIEAMLAACVPGGSSCDPQAVADDIRRYCNAWPTGVNQADTDKRAGCPAPERLHVTDEIIAQCLADVRDAERWRFARLNWGRLTETYEGDSGRVIEVNFDPHGWPVDAESLDAAIDAAQQKGCS